MQLAKKEGVELLLIAGDLFHRQPLLRQLREVNELFASIAPVQVVFMAGNHDYLKPDSAYRKISWASNIHMIFLRRSRR